MGQLKFGEETVPEGFFYADAEEGLLGKSASKIVAGRRAYARFLGTGCAGAAFVETDNIRTDPYESILSGPRLVPPPSLTSVDWSSMGQNITDSYMFDATVSFTCYSVEDFDNLDAGFFRIGNQCSLLIGYVDSTTKMSVYGRIKDFSFTVNEKLHYECSVTFTGAAGEVAAAFGLTNTQTNSQSYTKQDNAGNNVTLTPQSIVGVLRANAQQITPPPVNKSTSDGGTYCAATWGIGLKNSGWFWTTQDKKTIYYVALTELIDYINEQIPGMPDEDFRGFEGLFLRDYLEENGGSQEALKVQSSNPLIVLNELETGLATYGAAKMDFDDSDFYISIDELEKIEKDIKEDDSDNPHPVKSSIVQFIKRVLDTINLHVGHCIKLEMILYGQAGVTSNYGYEVINTKTIMNGSNAITTVNPLNKNSKIRSLNIQSHIDSKMAAISHTAKHSGEGHKFVKILTGCDPDPPSVTDDVNALNSNFATFGEIDYAVLADCVELQIKICNVNNPQTKAYNYGITVEIEVDGYNAYAYGKLFKMSGVPNLLANAYFVVLKQGHKYSNGDWTTTLEGHMYVDA